MDLRHHGDVDAELGLLDFCGHPLRLVPPRSNDSAKVGSVREFDMSGGLSQAGD